MKDKIETTLAIRTAKRIRRAWNTYGLALIFTPPTMLIISIIYNYWSWKPWAIWGVLMLFQRFIDSALKKAIKQIKEEKEV